MVRVPGVSSKTSVNPPRRCRVIGSGRQCQSPHPAAERSALSLNFPRKQKMKKLLAMLVASMFAAGVTYADEMKKEDKKVEAKKEMKKEEKKPEAKKEMKKTEMKKDEMKKDEMKK
jgi:pentapeptide MXKDX repeat protein